MNLLLATVASTSSAYWLYDYLTSANNAPKESAALALDANTTSGSLMPQSSECKNEYVDMLNPTSIPLKARSLLSTKHSDARPRSSSKKSNGLSGPKGPSLYAAQLDEILAAKNQLKSVKIQKTVDFSKHETVFSRELLKYLEKRKARMTQDRQGRQA